MQIQDHPQKTTNKLHHYCFSCDLVPRIWPYTCGCVTDNTIKRWQVEYLVQN